MQTTDIVPSAAKKQVLTVQQSANQLVVASPDDMDAGSGLLRQVKDAKSMLTERREEITRPMMKSLASVRDLFKPLELGLSEAEKLIKAKMLAFQIEEEEKLEKQKAKVEARVAKGTMRSDTAAGKLAEIGEVPKTKGVQTRKLTKVRVVDETLIPREYLVVDMVKVTQAILHEGIEIPGVEKYEEKVLAATRA